MYAIVEFDDGKEKTVEIVPCAWLNGEKCWWPNVPPDKAARMAKKGQPPGPGSHLYDAAVKGVFGSYEQGRKKLEMAQFTSDLSGGEEMPRKRRRVRPARWVDDDSTSVESDSDGFPPAPTAFITSEPPPRLEGSSQGLAHQSSPVPLLQSPCMFLSFCFCLCI